mmetsp:Transcript_58667/g.124513  ORF Transcript_58667/g.124513 Transcript_58667/m.124513 type:complete len:277 (+) Transcript_58667:629-1459(+)
MGRLYNRAHRRPARAIRKRVGRQRDRRASPKGAPGGRGRGPAEVHGGEPVAEAQAVQDVRDRLRRRGREAGFGGADILPGHRHRRRKFHARFVFGSGTKVPGVAEGAHPGKVQAVLLHALEHQGVAAAGRNLHRRTEVVPPLPGAVATRDRPPDDVRTGEGSGRAQDGLRTNRVRRGDRVRPGEDGEPEPGRVPHAEVVEEDGGAGGAAEPGAHRQFGVRQVDRRGDAERVHIEIAEAVGGGEGVRKVREGHPPSEAVGHVRGGEDGGECSVRKPL